jgi:DNA-binding response OmpR family regulator
VYWREGRQRNAAMRREFFMCPLVLISDRNPKRLERVRHLLESEGLEAVTASDSQEAMRLFVRREPELTLLQVDPSDELGMELCRDMKTLSAGRRRSVVVVAPRTSQPAAFDAGCNAFVGRRSGYESLVRTVRRFLGSYRKPRRTEAIELSR